MKGNLNITCGAHLSDWQYRFLVKHLGFQPWESVIHRAIIIVRILTIHAYKIEIHWISITFCIFKVLVSHLSFSLHVEVIKHKLFYNFYVVLFLQVIKHILQLWWTSSIDLSCLLCTSCCILNFWQISYCEDDSTIPFKIMHYHVLKKINSYLIQILHWDQNMLGIHYWLLAHALVLQILFDVLVTIWILLLMKEAYWFYMSAWWLPCWIGEIGL